MKQTPTPSLEDVLGGALPGRIHLLAGTAGTGKTSAALHFLRRGIERREHCVLVTLDRTSDLLSHGDHLGFDIRRFVRARRLTLLRYRPGFAARASDHTAPTEILDELRAHLPGLLRVSQHDGAAQPHSRIVFDPLSPFLANEEPGGAAVAALSEWLDHCGATALLTLPGDVSGDIDRKLDPLVERAAVIARFSRLGSATFQVELVRARHAIATAQPLAFDIAPGVGIVAPSPFGPASITPLMPEVFAPPDRGQQTA